jgi:6,7-dimethyl-8-ribityllumazine synthase
LAEPDIGRLHPCGLSIAGCLAAGLRLGHSHRLGFEGAVWLDAAAISTRNSKAVFQMSQDPVSSNGIAEDSSAGEKPVAHPRFAKPQRVAFVQSAWHSEVVAEGRLAFLAEIEARHIARAQIDIFEVPGSFEIPLHVQLLAKTRRYTAIVAAGLVVDDEYIAETVIRALMEVQLRTEIPVFSAVVTPQQFSRTADADFLRAHFASKGVEVAEACANTLLSLERLRGQVAAGIV